jgi:hypothetical protein
MALLVLSYKIQSGKFLDAPCKINGIIKRHFGKMSNKTKLRIHNITARTALRYGSETRVLNKRECLEAAQMRFVRLLLGYRSPYAKTMNMQFTSMCHIHPLGVTKYAKLTLS